jgi:hypothetical protein
MPTLPLTVDSYEEALGEFCLRAVAQVTKKFGPPSSLRIGWLDGPYWTRAYNLCWEAKGKGFHERTERDVSLALGAFPRAKLRALRKRHSSLAGFFLGEEGQDTLDPDEEIDVMPGECSEWIMGIFDEAIERVERRLSADKRFARCTLSLCGHDGLVPLPLTDYLKSVPDLRRHHAYAPDSEFLERFLLLWTSDRDKVKRWLGRNPKSPRISAAKAGRKPEKPSGGLWSKDVDKRRAAVVKVREDGLSQDAAVVARVLELAGDPDPSVRSNAVWALGATRPFSAQMRDLAVASTRGCEFYERAAGMFCLALSEDLEALALFATRFPDLAESDRMLLAGTLHTVINPALAKTLQGLVPAEKNELARQGLVNAIESLAYARKKPR